MTADHARAAHAMASAAGPARGVSAALFDRGVKDAGGGSDGAANLMRNAGERGLVIGLSNAGCTTGACTGACAGASVIETGEGLVLATG